MSDREFERNCNIAFCIYVVLTAVMFWTAFLPLVLLWFIVTIIGIAAIFSDG